MAEFTTIRIDYDDRGVATVTMDRPEVRNAFDDTLIGELTDAAVGLAADDGVRVVVLTGEGDVFSAGADLNWMRSVREASFEENVEDSRRLDALMRTLWELPKPLVGRVNGHALGGGVGLVACCDVAVASDEATFGFTEVLLGLAPAVVSPYVLRKIGRGFARAVFVTGERFGADRAMDVGLIHEVTSTGHLDDAVAETVERCLRGGPKAITVAKRLPEVALRPFDEATGQTVKTIAHLRVGDEGQEGMSAFLERRRPAWAPEEE